MVPMKSDCICHTPLAPAKFIFEAGPNRDWHAGASNVALIPCANRIEKPGTSLKCKTL